MRRSAHRRKILIVLPDAALGGGHAMNFRLAAALNALGWHVDVAFLFNRSTPQHYKDKYPTVHQIYMGGNGIFDRIGLPFRLARLAASYDLILAGLDLAATTYSYIAARIAKKPLMAWMHIAFNEQMRTVSRLDRQISLAIYRRIDIIVFPSAGARDSLESALGEKPCHANWPVLENFNANSPPSSLIKNPLSEHIFSKPVIINIGRLVPQKALDRLILAHADLLQRGIDHHLLILGEGHERGTLENLAIEAGVSNTVFMPGHMPTPLLWLRKATVFALCSRYEGLPLVLIEALQEGVPIVSMDCPAGPREILAGGDAGVLTAEGDQSSFCSALEELLRFPEVRSIYIQRGKERAKLYAADRIIPLWEDLLIKCTEAHDSDRQVTRGYK